MSCSVSPTTTIRSGFFSTVVVPNWCSTVCGNVGSPAVGVTRGGGRLLFVFG